MSTRSLLGAAVFVLVFLCYGANVEAQSGNSGKKFERDFHNDEGGSIQFSTEPDAEARAEFDRILASGGLGRVSADNRIRLRATTEIKYARAAVNDDDIPIVYYNPNLIRDIRRKSDNQWVLITVLAHEIGHHANRQLPSVGHALEYELEADCFAGVTLRRLSATMEQARSAMQAIAPLKGDETHPGLDDRVQAISAGWADSTACVHAPAEILGQTDNSCGGTVVKVAGRDRCLKPLETFKDCIDCPTMVVIPAGSFTMGSSDYKNESPPHEVTFRRPFAISRTIVTGLQYQYCVDVGRCAPGSLQSSRWNSDPAFRSTLGYRRLWAKWTEPGHPIVGVSWNDAQRYSGWLKAKTGQDYRLPSEAEWERAARGGVAGVNYWWGNQYDSEMANGHGGDPVTTPVESYPGHPYGLFDMAGNAFQWVDDCWHDNYAGQPANGAAWKTNCSSNGKYVMRGGSFASEPDGLHSSRRYLGRPDDRVFLLSFRLARTL